MFVSCPSRLLLASGRWRSYGLEQYIRRELWVAVIVLAVLTEAQQHGVHRHFIYLEEHRGDEPREKHGEHDRNQRRRQKRLRVRHGVGEVVDARYEERRDRAGPDDAQLAQEDEQVAHGVDRREP
eukprot:scaffold8047_cov31-Prasinocladus_malaysianus.AAC.1